MTQDALNQACRAIYQETKAFYSEIASDCSNLGFKILYGPPLIKPPILFIGYQPGGAEEDCARTVANGAHEGWPSKLEYTVNNGQLDRNMCAMFDTSRLVKCVGLNAIFIRSPNVQRYRKTVPRSTREKIEAFCLPRVRQIVAMIEPQCIVAIGLGTLDLFCTPTADLFNPKGRPLTRVGQIEGHKAIAVLHLSGARISTVDRNRIRDRVLAN